MPITYNDTDSPIIYLLPERRMIVCRLLFCLAVGVLALNAPRGDDDAVYNRSQTIVCAAAPAVAPASQSRQTPNTFLCHELRFRLDFNSPMLATSKFNLAYPSIPPSDHVRQAWSKGQWGWD